MEQDASKAVQGATGLGQRALFAGAIFLGSFLLFLVEPMAAKQLLPSLGGSAAVWVTCLVFFQTALLVAYLYAHWLTRSRRWQVHLALAAAGAAAALAWAARSWSAGPDSGWGAAHPVAAVFAALSVWIGLPFLALGATSPLLQVWWARRFGTAIPYRLFALSNLASLAALALYPSLLEPHWTLAGQRTAWAAGFVLFAVVVAALTWQTRAAGGGDEATGDESGVPRTAWRTRALWLLLPMGAAMQLSAVTSYLTSNVAAIPLLWILPLAVYLLTLIVAFEFPHLLPRWLVSRLMIVMLGSLGILLSHTDETVPMRVGIAFFLIEAFLACMFCHGEAYALKPRRRSESTLFYLLFAAGGALGSFLVGIAAPMVFRYNYDLALVFLVTALLALAVAWSGQWSERLLWAAASVMLVVLAVWMHVASERGTIAAARNFYGALRVKQNHGYPGATLRTLTNGTIQHGTQIFGSDALRKTPTTYYAEDSGVGLALRYCCEGRARAVGVVGLGAGTLAAYGRPGDRMRFYEINPADVPIAEDVFTYIRESGAQVDVVEGDGRVSLEQEAPQQFDVLVVDAFSGDAIPLHLLTTQAMALYRRHLRPGGILAFHISNQHVDLEPPIGLLAKAAGMTAMRVSNGPNDALGEFPSTWMLATDDASFFKRPGVAGRGRAPATVPGLRVWTDDYSALLPVMRW